MGFRRLFRYALVEDLDETEAVPSYITCLYYSRVCNRHGSKKNELSGYRGYPIKCRSQVDVNSFDC